MLYILDSHKGLIGTCEGFSYAIVRERTPIYVMGSAAAAREFVPGPSAIAVTLLDAHALAIPDNASLVVVGTTGPEATRHLFALDGAIAYSVNANIGMTVHSLDFGSCGHERLGGPGTGDFDLAMALVNHELRKRAKTEPQWMIDLEAQLGGS